PERIREVLDLVELSDRADDRVKTYSGGMKKRLDIACGLVHQPRLLVLDEPTLGLDIQTRTRIWEYIRRMRSGGTTILLTTHYMEEADRLCDRIAIIDQGKIQALGTPIQLKARVGGDVITLKLAEADLARAQGDVAPRLQTLSFVREVVVGQNLLVYVEPGQQSVPGVFEAVSGAGVHVEAFHFSRPTLDDVFLKFTGRSMRD
ncbi:MAG: ATP-binding cassette domain-containing protein, partial [Candidatus Wallbacteria bacterium]|nr:ATP-binding cassette domain-containing protein [Candidatus Wallbacteria bacterium]